MSIPEVFTGGVMVTALCGRWVMIVQPFRWRWFAIGADEFNWVCDCGPVTIARDLD